MGVIKRQGIKQVIINLAGVVFGALNTIFIYPMAMSLEEIGIFQFVLRAAGFFMPFALLANHIVSIHYFPRFKEEKKGHHGFLGFILLSAGITTSFFVFLLWVFKVPVASYYGQKSEMFLNYLGYLTPVLILMSFSQLLSVYISNFQRIVVPSIFTNLMMKFFLSLLAVAYFWSWISFEGLFNGLVMTCLLVLLGLIWYLGRLKEWHIRPDWKFLTPPLKKDIGTYFWYNTLFGLGFTIATQPDVLMVGTLSGLTNVALYTPGFFIAEAIDAPRKALLTITGPMIAASLAENNMTHVEELYKKTSLNQLIMGIFLLACAWLCAGYLFEIMPNGHRFTDGKIIILILGIARVVDMSFGANYEILNYSKYFRLNFWAVLITAVLTVVLNIVLIREFSFYGAAYATLFSIILYNLFKSGVIYAKFGIHPFSMPTIIVVLAGLAAYFLSSWIPEMQSPLSNMVLKCLVMVLSYGAIIYVSKASPDLNSIFTDWKNKFLKHK
jgi:O-antigen/teichoic acid export membrane protein